ncbi:MAG: tetratricopeptide repeat protein [Blastocatellia bacterium]
MNSPLTINEMQAIASSGQVDMMSEEARQALVESIFQKIRDIGIASYEQGQFERAKEIFEELIHIAPQSAYAHAALGTVLTKRGENEAALAHLSRAVELDPHEISAWVNRAEVYLRFNRQQEAAHDLQQAIALQPAGDSPVAQRARFILNTLMTRLQAESGEMPARQAAETTETKTGGLMRSWASRLGKKK